MVYFQLEPDTMVYEYSDLQEGIIQLASSLAIVH